MDQFFIKLCFRRLEDWLQITPSKFKAIGGGKLLQIYPDRGKLLEALYPHYPWNFTGFEDKLREKEKRAEEKIHELMERLFIQFNFKTLHQWLLINKHKFRNYGGGNILKLCNDDMATVLSTLYPNYPWVFPSRMLHKLHPSTASPTTTKKREKGKGKGKKEGVSLLARHQRRMDACYHKLRLKSLSQWVRVPLSKLKAYTKTFFEQHYRSSLPFLLQSIYPHYPWEELLTEQQLLLTLSQSLSRQREVMDALFFLLRLPSLSRFRRSHLLLSPETKLLSRLYHHHFPSLLSSLYPHYPWPSSPSSPSSHGRSLPKLNPLVYKRIALEGLYEQLKLRRLDHWLRVDRRALQVEEDSPSHFLSLLSKKKFKRLLIKLYPHYPWNAPQVEKYRFRERQKRWEYMEHLFSLLRLRRLHDWLKVKRYQITLHGGLPLLKLYGRDMRALLSDLYPHYPWPPPRPPSSPPLLIRSYKSMEYQRERMGQLYARFKLKSLEGWYRITPLQFSLNGGQALMHLYHNDYLLLLRSLYPHYPWVPELIGVRQMRLDFTSLEVRRDFMDRLYHRLHLSSLHDWYSVSRHVIRSHGGGSLVSYYDNDLPNLLCSIYPHYPWHFQYSRVREGELPYKKNFSSIEYQRDRMDQLYELFGLTQLSDWLKVKKREISANRGAKLLQLYHFDLCSLLSAIYPHYPWDFSANRLLNRKNYFEKMENRYSYMERLFHRFKLPSLSAWTLIKRNQMNINGGWSLLQCYQNDMQLLLHSLYPHYPWSSDYRSHLRSKLALTISLYHIARKRDWYRVPLEFDRKCDDLYTCLRVYYPEERWNKAKVFSQRNKKTTQRLLFAFTRRIFPSSLIFENYFHPQLIYSTRAYELDLFLPAFQLALEYQGEHHYDDLPGGFPGLESNQFRDQVKEDMASLLHISILYVPYWWDHSLPSLHSSLLSLSLPFNRNP